MKNTSSRHLSGRVTDEAETAYAVLGVKRGASTLEVREAYIRLVKKFHPDMNSGDPAAERRFKRVNQAYEELKSGCPSQHHELEAFPRRRQHRHHAIVIATAAALFAVSPALVSLAIWKTGPVMAAQPRIELAKAIPLPPVGASEAFRREARLFEGPYSAALAASRARKPPTGDALQGLPAESFIQTYPAAPLLDKNRARIDLSSQRPEGRHTPHAALAGKVLRQASLTKRRCCGRQGSRKLRTGGGFREFAAVPGRPKNNRWETVPGKHLASRAAIRSPMGSWTTPDTAALASPHTFPALDLLSSLAAMFIAR